MQETKYTTLSDSFMRIIIDFTQSFGGQIHFTFSSPFKMVEMTSHITLLEVALAIFSNVDSFTALMSEKKVFVFFFFFLAFF